VTEIINKGGRGYKAYYLSPVQLKVLKAAATGCTLAKVAHLTGMTEQQVATRMNQIYKRLGVVNTVSQHSTPAERRTRRAWAVQEARRRGHDI
jgi:DNA-binding CsgD family transcriptional regulator